MHNCDQDFILLVFVVLEYALNSRQMYFLLS